MIKVGRCGDLTVKELCAFGIFEANLNFGDQNYHQFQLEQPGKVLSHVDCNWDVWKLTKVSPGIKIVTMAESHQTGKRNIWSSLFFYILHYMLCEYATEKASSS